MIPVLKKKGDLHWKRLLRRQTNARAICYQMISIHLEEVDHQEKLLQRSFFLGTQGVNRCKVCGCLHIPPLKVSPCLILSQEMFSERMQHLNVCCERCKSSFISREYFKKV
jgi:hypothetical protein